MIWLVSGAAGDGIIALGLLWRLRRVKTPFTTTADLIKRLTYSTIQTGAIGQSCSILGQNKFLKFRRVAVSGKLVLLDKIQIHEQSVDVSIFQSTGGIQISRAHIVHIDADDDMVGLRFRPFYRHFQAWEKRGGRVSRS
ncbi:hypothetical protein K435DRAFT_22541 [Dendrothele bispora CBS 962.96]|uniref:Uncharacterized protein n=1 Tax=Dendrothele bispora (strain CBS 962.96) TaxID=1314807 RepID=A0A4S8MUR8_DENBC|nr:hypothetical protein K435DRAFT_22541 [Dendrothele bispora CBS 962.96]